MFRPRTLLPAVAAVCGLLGMASAAQGGWITIKNETKQVIVVQETGGPLNRPIRGKCVKLQPGETYREYQLLSGTKNVQIYDADAPTTTLVHERMAWDKEDAAFAVKADGKKVALASGTQSTDQKKTDVKAAVKK